MLLDNKLITIAITI